MRGSERHAIVAADVRGQAALLKKPLKHRKGVVFFGGRERLAGQQVPAGVVGDRKRITILMFLSCISALETSPWLPLSVILHQAIQPPPRDQNFTTARPTTLLSRWRSRYLLISPKPMVLMVCWILPSAASAMTSLRSALLPQNDP